MTQAKWRVCNCLLRWLLLLLVPMGGTAAAARVTAALFLHNMSIFPPRTHADGHALIMHGGMQKNNGFLDRHRGIDLRRRHILNRIAEMRVRL
jgi:hypothetical protein